MNAGLTGEPVLEDDELRQAGHDSMAASILALVLCSVIFIVAYGQVWRPFKAALCLLVGLGYCLGFTTLAIGHLNILTITFAPMLIGLAIDFGIHFISRYEEEMRNRLTGVTGRYLMQVYARKDLWHHDNQREFLQELETVVPPDKVTGTPSSCPPALPPAWRLP